MYQQERGGGACCAKGRGMVLLQQICPVMGSKASHACVEHLANYCDRCTLGAKCMLLYAPTFLFDSTSVCEGVQINFPFLAAFLLGVCHNLEMMPSFSWPVISGFLQVISH